MIEFEIEQDNTIDVETQSDETIEIKTTVDSIEFKNITGNVEDNSKLVNYIDSHGGKIDKIKVNGTEQPIENKVVDLSIPTKTSDLQNDSNFITDANYVHTDNNYSNEDKENLSIIDDEVGAIRNLIPEEATASNKLADKNYVDTHIPTIPSFQLEFDWTTGSKSLVDIKGTIQDI